MSDLINSIKTRIEILEDIRQILINKNELAAVFIIDEMIKGLNIRLNKINNQL